MANQEHLEILKQGVDTWNEWRLQKQIELRRKSTQDKKLAFNFDYFMEASMDSALGTNLTNLIDVNLEGVDLNGAMLPGVNFRRANLQEIDLDGAIGSDADFSHTNLMASNLSYAFLVRTDFSHADLSNADLTGADLTGARFWETDLTNADLRGANLTGASLIEANIAGAKISKCSVYGVNVWNLKGEFADQDDLIIDSNGSKITVDNIKTAQFLYLILNNEEIRGVINTLTSRSVLILGRFAIPERKDILDALRSKLRECNLLPIVFDFDRPIDRDFTETIKILAGMSYFVIADVTNPKSSPLELQATIPDYQIPFVPIIQKGEQPFAMMVDLQKKYDWVLPTRAYSSKESLINGLKQAIVIPAIQKHNELRLLKEREPELLSIDDIVQKNTAN